MIIAIKNAEPYRYSIRCHWRGDAAILHASRIFGHFLPEARANAPGRVSGRLPEGNDLWEDHQLAAFIAICGSSGSSARQSRGIQLYVWIIRHPGQLVKALCI
jgi:hypothetical protein